MALRTFADLSRYQQAAAQPTQNPLDALLGGVQQGIQLQQLPQTLQNDVLNQQLQRAIQQAKIQQLQGGEIQNVGGRLVQVDPVTRQVKVILDSAATPTNYQLAGYDPNLKQFVSYDPRTNALTIPQSPQGVAGIGPLQPKTLAPETFSTVDTAEKGLLRVPNRGTAAVPLTLEGQGVTKPVKPEADVKVKQFTDANGFLYTQPVTGGDITQVKNQDGTPFNAGVANATFSSDQGIFSIPKKSEGAPTATPVTTPGAQGSPPTQLTKPSSGKGGKDNGEGTKQFLSDLADSALSTITTLEPQISNTTVGLGSLTSGIPLTPASDFKANVKSLASDIRLGVLQQMKLASKNGSSGLGQLSNQEGQSLESALGSLEQSQSPDQFKKNLAKVKEPIKKWKAGVQKFGVDTSNKIGRFEILPPE